VCQIVCRLTAMRLNDWQRFWVVICALWGAAVLGFAWMILPTTAPEREISSQMGNISDSAIRARLNKEENSALSDAELNLGKFGGRLINPYTEPNPQSVPQPKPSDRPLNISSTLLSVSEFARLVKAKYPEYSNTADDVVVADVLERYPVYRDQVDPRAVAEASQRYENTINAQKRATEIARSLAETSLVHRTQLLRMSSALAFWVGSSALLYFLGWSVGWIRRGFHEDRPRTAPSGN
jgi:hypothetical protein